MSLLSRCGERSQHLLVTDRGYRLQLVIISNDDIAEKRISEGTTLSMYDNLHLALEGSLEGVNGVLSMDQQLLHEQKSRTTCWWEINVVPIHFDDVVS